MAHELFISSETNEQELSFFYTCIINRAVARTVRMQLVGSQQNNKNNKIA